MGALPTVVVFLGAGLPLLALLLQRPHKSFRFRELALTLCQLLASCGSSRRQGRGDPVIGASFCLRQLLCQRADASVELRTCLLCLSSAWLHLLRPRIRRGFG